MPVMPSTTAAASWSLGTASSRVGVVQAVSRTTAVTASMATAVRRKRRDIAIAVSAVAAAPRAWNVVVVESIPPSPRLDPRGRMERPRRRRVNTPDVALRRPLAGVVPARPIRSGRLLRLLRLRRAAAARRRLLHRRRLGEQPGAEGLDERPLGVVGR